MATIRDNNGAKWCMERLPEVGDRWQTTSGQQVEVVFANTTNAVLVIDSKRYTVPLDIVTEMMAAAVSFHLASENNVELLTDALVGTKRMAAKRGAA